MSDALPKLTPNELDILHRMRQIDKGEGCHAAVRSIGNEYFERPGRSVSQTRLIIGRLRRKGFLKYVGVHAERGTNIYLIEGKTYQPERIPAVDPLRTGSLIARSRDSKYGATFETATASATLNGTAPKRGGASIAYRGVDVPSQIHRNFGERTWKAAVDAFLLSYPNVDDKGRRCGSAGPVLSASKTLEAICARLSADQRQKDEQAAAARLARLAEAKAKPAAAPVVDEEFVRNLLAQMKGEVDPARAPARSEIVTKGAVTVRDIVAREVAFRGVTNKPSTAETYKHYQRQLVGHFGELPADQLDESAIVEYCAKRKATTKDARQPASMVSILRETKLLFSALQKSYRSKEISKDPATWWPKFRAEGKKGTRWLRREDFSKLRKQLKPYQRRWIDFAVLTGGDYGELLALRRRDCDVDQCLVHLSCGEGGGKTAHRSRVLRLPPLLLHHVRKIEGADEPILRPWRNRIRDLRDACARAGIERVNLKDLRRTFATWLRQAGTPSHEIKAMLGHSRGSTMLDKHYAVPDPARWAAYLDKLL